MPRRRSAFTLLEVLLATAIAVLVMYGLYLVIDIQLSYSAAGRDTVEHATLARTLMNRISSDVAPSIGLPDPSRYKAASGAASGTTGTTTTAMSTSVPLAVVGDSTQLTLFVSRVPRAPVQGAMSSTPAVVSDQRRITYWLAGSGDTPAGLARQEVPLVTADPASVPTAVGTEEESRYVIAREVVSLEFEYFDGTTWQTSWDGTQVGEDGVTPIGPPLAIAITIELAPTDQSGRPLGRKKFRHVVSIPTANGVAQTMTTEP